MTSSLQVKILYPARWRRRISEAQGRRREAGSEGSVEQSRDPMDKNRIRGLPGRTSEADFVQAADSLSFLETLDWLTVDWVRSGRYTVAQAREKLDFTIERIGPSVALAAVLPLYESAMRTLDAAAGCAMDLKKRRALASSRRFLFGLPDPPEGSTRRSD